MGELIDNSISFQVPRRIFSNLPNGLLQPKRNSKLEANEHASKSNYRRYLCYLITACIMQKSLV